VTAPAPLARTADRLGRQLADRLPDRLVTTASPAAPSGRFSWLVVGACTWILAGLFVDGYFHVHDDSLESFFTPWHALLYSGAAAAVVVHLLENRRAGGLRPGYAGSLVGGLIVSVAGAADMVWHEVFGVEADLEALLSPPHLLLIVAGTLVFAGPLRAALLAGAGGLPAAFSAAFVVTGLAFFTQYANPFTHLYPVAGYVPYDGAPVDAAGLAELGQVAGVAGVVVFAALVGGSVAVLRTLRDLPAGAYLVALAVPVAFLGTLRGTLFLLPAALVAGLLTERLRRLGPAALAAASSALLFTGWALSLSLLREVSWSLELLSGSVCSAVAAAYLVGWAVQAGRRSASGVRPQA
jgi:hypothetical protein